MQLWNAEGALDRVDGLRRSADWVADRWARPGTKVLWVDEQGLVATDGSELRPIGMPATGDYDPQRHILLGLADGEAWFAVTGAPQGPTASLRRLGAVCTGMALEVAVGAVALTTWHRMDPHCSGCGRLTEVINGGVNRRCPGCGRVHFPRQDPAVIVAVLDAEDRILLGRQPSWDVGRLSVLAGFVEAGESLEQAVHREILEESGVRLDGVRYIGSQPWPFPRSLMLGFAARARTPELRIDRHEIEYAAWFTRSDLDAALADGTVQLPGAASIAHLLIASWREGMLTR